MGIHTETHAPHESKPLRLGEEDKYDAHASIDCIHPSTSSKSFWMVSMSLSLSVALNIILAIALLSKQSLNHKDTLSVTKFAGLARDVPKFFNSSSIFGLGSANETERSIVWESLDTSAGEISLNNQWAAQRGLPESTPFFWDHERSIYLINAHHSLHCLRKVRRWVTLSYYNTTQLDTYAHLVHCMDHLLQNIMCEADDTPMYTSPTRNATTGLGQQRMCRSWDILTEWANSQTACFGYINETQGVDAVIQRFRYCPAESELLKPMRQYFGYDGAWFEPLPADMETLPHYWEGFHNEQS